MRRVVVLPQPDGPSSAKKLPCGMTRSRSCTAMKPLGYSLRRPVSRRSRPTADAVSGTCDIGEISFVLPDLGLVERHEAVGGLEVFVGREDELVVDHRVDVVDQSGLHQVRSDLLHRLL